MKMQLDTDVLAFEVLRWDPQQAACIRQPAGGWGREIVWMTAYLRFLFGEGLLELCFLLSGERGLHNCALEGL